MRHAQERADCGVRALAVVCGCDYKEAYDALAATGRKPRGKTWDRMLIKAAKSLGFKLKFTNTSKGATVLNVAKELPSGRWLIKTAGHYIGVVDGIAIDWAEGTRKRIKYAFRPIPITRRTQ